MQLSAALGALGVDDSATLTDAERSSLDDDGLLVLPSLLRPDQLDRIRGTFLELLAVRHTFADTYDDPDGSGNRLTLANLQNKSDVFDVCFSHPKVVAAVSRVLSAPDGPDAEGFSSNGVHGRLNPPGWGGNVRGQRQALHTDGAAPDGTAPTFPQFFTCNSIWFLCDFDISNGATHVVPGSHRFGARPDASSTPHPDEIRLTGPAGTVVVFNSHVWHSAGLNESSGDRPALTSFWGRGERTGSHRALPDAEKGEAWGQLTRQAYARLAPHQRRLFDTETADLPDDDRASPGGSAVAAGARL
jgi:ectoine hydroxylase-related dioxygenase (phytanoyl-CoA dioxygenase family)